MRYAPTPKVWVSLCIKNRGVWLPHAPSAMVRAWIILCMAMPRSTTGDAGSNVDMPS